MDILSYLDMVRSASTGQKIVGNVHGFVLTELIDKLKRAGLYGKIQIANMVRNPITFIDSYTALVCQRKYANLCTTPFLPNFFACPVGPGDRTGI